MTELKQLRCEACRADAPPAAAAEIQAWLREIPDWTLLEVEGEKRLQRVFRFRNYAEALDFVNRVAALAEAENHHPSMLLEWGRVTVCWWTHKIRGLHRNDFIMAARTDGLAPPAPAS